MVARRPRAPKELGGMGPPAQLQVPLATLGVVGERGLTSPSCSHSIGWCFGAIAIQSRGGQNRMLKNKTPLDHKCTWGLL